MIFLNLKGTIVSTSRVCSLLFHPPFLVNLQQWDFLGILFQSLRKDGTTNSVRKQMLFSFRRHSTKFEIVSFSGWGSRLFDNRWTICHISKRPKDAINGYMCSLQGEERDI